MNAIARQVVYLASFLVICHIVTIGVSYAIYPNPSHLDTMQPFTSRDAVYHTHESYLTLGTLDYTFDSPNNLVVLGASNALGGFRPPETQPLFPTYLVHNLAFNGTNITGIYAIVKMAYMSIPLESRPGTVFVLGLCYPEFRDNKGHLRAWERGDLFRNYPTEILAKELRRWGLFGLEDGRLVPRIPERYVKFAVALVRPLSFADKCERLCIERLDFGVKPFITSTLTACHINPTILFAPWRVGVWPGASNEAERMEHVNSWKTYMATRNGEILDEQFNELRELCRLVEQNTGLLVLVDMPLPDWHKEHSPHYAQYKTKLTAFLKSIGEMRHVVFVDMTDMKAQFHDATHPKPHTSPDWAQGLRDRLHLPEDPIEDRPSRER